MILVCSFCHARYLIAADSFAKGPRQVRCVRCSHAWLADTSQDVTNQQPAASTAPTAALGAAQGTASAPLPSLHIGKYKLPDFVQKTAAVRISPMVIAVSLVLLAIVVLLLDSQTIGKKWPWAENVYNKIGIHIYHAGEGLRIQDVRSELHFEDGIMHLIVTGNIVNETKKTQLVPPIMASAIGSNGDIMQSWQIDPVIVKLAAGAHIPFSSTINSPKGTVVEMSLIFVEPHNAAD